MVQAVTEYDAIVVGSGQGGTPLAAKLASRGEKVALIEPRFLGGTCVNTGCTPTKAMVGSAQVAHYAREASRWGVRASNVSVDLPAVLKRKEEIVLRSRTGWEKSMNGDKQPRWIRAKARFVAPKQLQVGDEIVSGGRIFLDTGVRPAVPKIVGLDSVPYLTNESIIELKEVPEHLLVLGGGYIGLEFGQMFRRFGSEVTVVQDGPRILPREDDDITDALRQALEGEGVRILVNAKAAKAEASGGRVTLQLEGGEAVSGSHLLIAAGRAPNTEELDLQKAGVKTNERGFIVVNERLETSAPDIWAIGDVTGGPAFTHISYNDFQIIYGNLYEGANLSTKTRLIPYAVYTDPELGRVGMTENEARQTGKKLKIGTMPMSKVARALERGETAGFMKLLVDAENDRILGAAILGSEGGELVQILSTLMLAEKPYTLLKGAIYIHPTLAEGFFGLMESVKAVD